MTQRPPMARDVPPNSPNAPQTAWQVTGQQRTTGLDSAGRPVAGYEVQFQTAKGVNGHVFVPDSMYTPGNVRAAVAAKAGVMDEVAGLAG